MIWACASECSSSFSGQYCSNLKIGNDIFRSQLLAANKVSSAVPGTRQQEWGVCLKGNVSLYIFTWMKRGLPHPPGKVSINQWQRWYYEVQSLDSYYEVFVSSHPSKICPWTAHCLTSSGLSNSVIHFCSPGNIRSTFQRRRWTLL